MSTGARDTVAVVIAIAILVFSILVGSALVARNGQAQVCETNHGHWVDHYDSTSPVANGWIHTKECRP